MKNIFCSTLILSFFISFCTRPLNAGGEVLVELSSLFPTIRETKTADIPKLINADDTYTAVKLIKVYCHREDCPLSQEAKDTFVHLAAKHPFPMLEILIKEAVEEKRPNQELLEFMTPFAGGRLEGALESAILRKNTPLAQSFLSAIQAHPDQLTNSKVLTAFEKALKTDNHQLVAMFIQNSTINPFEPLPESGKTPLDLAYQKNALQAVEALEPLYIDNYSSKELDEAYTKLTKQNRKIASLKSVKRTLITHDSQVSSETSIAQSNFQWKPWGIGAAAVTTVGIIAIIIARHLLHR